MRSNLVLIGPEAGIAVGRAYTSEAGPDRREWVGVGPGASAAPNPPTPASCRGFRGPLRWLGLLLASSRSVGWYSPGIPTLYTHPVYPPGCTRVLHTP